MSQSDCIETWSNPSLLKSQDQVLNLKYRSSKKGSWIEDFGAGSCLQEIDSHSKITGLLLKNSNGKFQYIDNIIVFDWSLDEVFKWLSAV